jgi:2-oxoglutarate/2-oxoacid ferredoxin oxidoreductase subunit alpha
MSSAILMQGNEACVEGALRAGMKFYAGYPITPSTEIAELSALKLPKHGGKFIQMEDEISSIAAVIGASLCGLKSMTATSGPGFSLKQENIGYAAMTEVPCVIVDVMRGGPSTGLPTCVSQSDVMQSRWGTHGDHPIIVLAPSTVRDIYYMTIKAFNYSEKYRIPVILLLDEVNAHMRESVYIDAEVEVISRKRPDDLEDFVPYRETTDGVPSMADFGEGFKWHVTGLCHNEFGHPTNDPNVTDRLLRRLHDKIEKDRDNIILYDTFNMEDCEELLVAFGSTARVCRESINYADGKKVGIFVPYSLWPFPDKELTNIIKEKNIKRVFVPELNRGQLLLEIQRYLGGMCEVIGINKYNGELFTPDEIRRELRRG